MMRLLSSLHFTRWLRVVAVAGVVLASAAAADSDADQPAQPAYRTASANSWCPRC